MKIAANNESSNEASEYLKIRGNPHSREQYFVVYKNDFCLSGGKISLNLTFIPDALILERKSYDAYLREIFAAGKISEDISLETLAGEIIEGLSNELVPFWINIRISLAEKNENGDQFRQVIMEDRQPGWDNPALLSRLSFTSE